MSDTFFFSVIIRPGIDPFDRHDIEDELSAALEAQGLGEVTGGGSMIDGSMSDISINITDPVRGLAVIREVLRRCGVPPRTTILQHQPEEMEHPLC